MKKSSLFMLIMLVSSIAVSAVETAVPVAISAVDPTPMPAVRYYDLNEKFEISISETVYVDDITIRFDSMAAPVCVRAPCNPHAGFTIGRNDEDTSDSQAWASKQISLEVGDSETVYGATITLLQLDNKAVLVVTKDDSDYDLGEKFNLALGDTATVDSLDIQFARVDDICDTDYCPDAKAVFTVSRVGTASATISLKVGETLTLWQHDFTLLALDAQATLVVNKDENRYDFGEKFQLSVGETAIVDTLDIKFAMKDGRVCVATESDCPREDLAALDITSRLLDAPTQRIILAVGESQVVFGATIKLLALDDKATLVVNKVQRVEIPVCTNIGTRSEGWVVGDEIIMYDTCVCTAVCRGDGFYSTCSGELIMKASCDSSGSVPGSTGTAIEPSVGVAQPVPDSGVVQGATPIAQETTASVSTAASRAEPSMVVESISLVDADKPYYEVTGKQDAKLFWIIPYQKTTSVKVDAQTYEVIE